MRVRVLSPLLLVLGLAMPAFADVPGSIEVTCDVARKEFRTAAAGQSDVKFKLWSTLTAGTQLGSDYTVPMTNLAVAKRYTDRYDSVTPRKAERINAVIGSDGSPVLLPANGQAWFDVTVGSTTLGCDFAATASLAARRRLQSVPFARECETCVTAQETRDISARLSLSANFTPPPAITTAIPFTTEVWDTDGLHDPGNPTRLTAPVDGKYMIFGSTITYQSPSGGLRDLAIFVNGSIGIVAQRSQLVTADTAKLSVSTHYELAAGEYAELMIYNDSGTDVLSGVTSFGMVKLP